MKRYYWSQWIGAIFLLFGVVLLGVKSANFHILSPEEMKAVVGAEDCPCEYKLSLTPCFKPDNNNFHIPVTTFHIASSDAWALSLDYTGGWYFNGVDTGLTVDLLIQYEISAKTYLRAVVSSELNFSDFQASSVRVGGELVRYWTGSGYNISAGVGVYYDHDPSHGTGNDVLVGPQLVLKF